ncbi:hypothetical protein [uncultured Muribaculum sp.]|nr:hypothetical protein [uncultured Muribaculum sp.]
MMFAALAISTFTACSSDDDDDLTQQIANGIIGYWQPVDLDPDGGTYYLVHFDGKKYYGYEGNIQFEGGTYTISGDMITVTGIGADEDSWTWKVTLSDNNNRLKLYDMEYQESIEYVRVNGPSDLPETPEIPDVPMPDHINISDFVGTWTYTDDAEGTLDITFDANGNISLHQYGMESGHPFSFHGTGTFTLVGTKITTRVLWEGETEEEVETGTLIGLSQKYILIRYQEGDSIFDQLFTRK